MATRIQRTEAIERLQRDLGDAAGVYLTDFTGIDVVKMTKLRADLRSVGSRYVVVKNTLTRIALEKCGRHDLVSYVQGPVGVAVSSDEATAPAKVLKAFRNENKGLLDIRVAYVDGILFSADETDRLADLPSRDVLLSQMLSCLNAPIGKLAGTLSGILTKFVGTLEAVRNKRETEGSNTKS